jgi:hypothetical protein
MNKSASDWIAASQRPQRYLNRDPHKHVEFVDEMDQMVKVTILESFIWGAIMGFAVGVILFVPSPF